MFKKIALFLSAFVPMYVIVIIKILIDVTEGNEKGDVVLLMVVITLVTLVVVGLCGLCYIIHSKKTTKTKVNIIKTRTETAHFVQNKYTNAHVRTNIYLLITSSIY